MVLKKVINDYEVPDIKCISDELEQLFDLYLRKFPNCQIDIARMEDMHRNRAFHSV